MQDTVKIVLITGPAGIGKSTLCWEIGAKLEEAQVAHAIVETDELDQVYPKPTGEDLERLRPGATDVSALNLAAIWSTYRALGHSRLIMSGVIMHPRASTAAGSLPPSPTRKSRWCGCRPRNRRLPKGWNGAR